MYKIKCKTKISCQTEFIYAHNLKNILPITPKLKIEVCLLNSTDVNLLREVWPVNITEINTRFNLEHSECFISKKDQNILSYHWVQYKGTHFIQQANWNFAIPSGSFIIYHVRVKNDFQGFGISSCVYSTILSEYQKRGYNQALIYTSKNNIANQKSLVKIGFYKFFSFKSIQLGKKFVRLTSHKNIQKAIYENQ